MINRLVLMRVAAFLLLLACASMAQANSYVQQLQARAAQMRLADTRDWHALLHYEKNYLRAGLHSTVATPWFFRSEKGRTDPQAELDATLAAFMDPSELKPRDESAQCVYPARYAFLDAHLQFDTEQMPVADCARYQRWLKGLNPESVSLIFPSAYLNSPASMFGHTLLRVDSKEQTRSTELLAYAINFAANTDQQHGFSFAYKGMTGGFPGIFGIFPYYEKVKQYAWIESRDVWAYPLDFSQAELTRMLAHLWEMRGVEFDYYFLTKNCAYQLLSLLEAGRPSLKLVDQFSWYAIPADTIRELSRQPGLLGKPSFRPSLGSTLAYESEQLTSEQRDLALAVGAGGVAPSEVAGRELNMRDQARVLEVAHDYNYYRYQAGQFERALAVPRSRAILLARSKLPISSDFTSVPAPSTAPEAGHPTLRLSAAGVWEDDEFSLGLRVRPAYHDVLDDPGGYTDGAQINFLDLGLRLDPSNGELKFEDLTLIDILSLSPRSRLFKPVSWQVGTGFRRRPSHAVFGDEPNNIGYFVEGGPGLAWGSLDSLAVYGFALGSADANTGFDPDYALGVGASLGLLARPADAWQLRAEVGGLSYEAGGEGRRRWAFVEQQIPLIGRYALRMRAEYEDAAGESIGRGVLTLHGYYE